MKIRLIKEINLIEFWNTVLSGEKILSDREANEIEKPIIKLRKERGFRI